MSARNMTMKILNTALLAFISILMIAPVIWMISTSLKYESEVFNFPIQWIPETITWENYKKAFLDFPYLTWYYNTIRNTAVIVFSILLVSSMAGFAFAKINFKGKNVIFIIYIASLMIPGEMRLIPQFILFKELGLINTQWAVILPWMLFVAFAIFFMRQAFMAVPNELIEAAKIDGCGYVRMFVIVTLPLVKSTLVALGILAFTWGWNEYTAPLIYIQDIEKQMLAVGIASFKEQYSSNFALQMAGATVALVPVILVYLIAQKYFTEGIAQSGIKG